MRKLSKKYPLSFAIWAILICSSHACKLHIDDAGFVWSEVDENINPGKLKVKIPVIREPGERIQIDSHKTRCCAEKYVTAIYCTESESIDFYLLKRLSVYRQDKWIPSVQSDFTLHCSGESFRFTHLLVIKDENLYAPKFNEETYNGIISYSKYKGLEFKFTNTTNIYECVIKIRDFDFNPSHGNVSLTCVGEACSYFYIELINNGFVKGYSYDVTVKLNYEQVSIENLNSGQQFTIELVASDSLQTSNATVNIAVEVDGQAGVNSPVDSSHFPMIAVAVAGGIALVLIMACGGTLTYYVIRSKKSTNMVRKLTEAEIREFLDGTANISTEAGRSVDINTPIMALPYNRSFEIPRERLRIDETTILGAGAFGVVWKGSVVYSNGDGIVVAVKSIKKNVGVLYFRALLSELKIMAYLGKHNNIVSLVGACTHNIRKREVYIAVQYCANGNFHNYLKSRRGRFNNLVIDGKLELTNAALYSYMYSNKGIFSKSFSTLDLLRWAVQIASGLQYLESLGVIHGDLATRNILLDNDRIAKIADFGLSRRLIDYSSYYYTKTTQVPLPWKWMAPESLKDLKFSKKSDIWSFGIVLWEIFTLSSTPFPGLNWDESFIEKLENGTRPKKPAFATFYLYNMMTDCWELEPHDRPAILNIKRALEDITNKALWQKQDASYMRFSEEQQVITMLNEDQDGYLLPNDPNRIDYVDT